ncbi:MAG TPA: hypothetical protein VLF42_15300 [Burkholderiales bacterium]|nr:hypothetical protein [Burkholderiales bacterium]
MRTALLLLLLVPGFACAQAGRLLLAAGEVTIVRGAQEIRAVAGSAVQSGDTIRVGPRSNAQLRMSDESIIALRSDSVFRIDEYAYAGPNDEASRSFFSLVKGGMRTVGGAIVRQQAAEFLQASARPEAPAGPQPAAAEKKPAPESKVVESFLAPLRAVAGALTPTRHAVRVPTATIGVRGTHYTIVHCDNDCYEPRRTAVASLLAQSDAGSPGVGELAPNGSYAAVSDGRVIVFNNRPPVEFGKLEYFYVASMDSSPQGLIAPPSFLFDRLGGQERFRGRGAPETTANMQQSGLNAEGRPSDPPTPPKPPAFVVTETRTESGDLVVLGGSGTATLAFLAAFTNGTGGPGAQGAFVDPGMLTTSGARSSQTLDAFSVPAAATFNPASGNFSGTSEVDSVVDQTQPNPVGAYWGIWYGGSVSDASGSTLLSSVNKFHYLVGPLTPPDVIASKSGSFPLVHIQGMGTTPTSSDGTLGQFTASQWAVNFTTQTVLGGSFNLNFPNQTWTFNNGFSAPIQTKPGGGAFIDTSTPGTCTGGTCATSTAAAASLKGAFMGPVGDHLGVSINATAGSATAQTVQLFSCSQAKC